MRRKAYKAQRVRLLALASTWTAMLGLSWWTVKLSYDRDGSSFRAAEVTEDGFHSGIGARCFPDWRYALATIVWNMPEVAKLSDAALEQMMVHELCHVLLHEMREGADHDLQAPHEERVATMLAKAFLWSPRRGRLSRKRYTGRRANDNPPGATLWKGKSQKPPSIQREANGSQHATNPKAMKRQRDAEARLKRGSL